MTAAQTVQAAEPGGGRRVKIKHAAALGRCVVSTLDLAAVVAHKHHNLTWAVDRMLEEAPHLANQVIWSEYRGRNRRLHRMCYLTSVAVGAISRRMHNVPDCLDVRARLENIRVGLTVMDDRIARGEPAPDEVVNAEPAPDSEIQPPMTETADALQPAEAAGDGLPSWVINASVENLRVAGLPADVLQLVEKWNADRCAALAAWIYAKRAPH